MTISIDACVAQHQGDRAEQQDRVALVPHPKGGGVALAVVADGMGGHTGGVLAAQQVIHTSRNNLEQFSVRDEDPRDMLEASIKEASNGISLLAPGKLREGIVIVPEEEGWSQRLGGRLILKQRSPNYLAKTGM